MGIIINGRNNAIEGFDPAFSSGGTGVNVTSLNVSGISTVNAVQASSLNVSGISTFSGGVNASQGADLARLRVAGITTITDTTQSTDKDTGALVVEGGVGIEKDLNVGGNVKVVGVITATSIDAIGATRQVRVGIATSSVTHGSAYGSTGLSTTITLGSANNKVLVLVTQPIYVLESIAQIDLRRTIAGVGTTVVTVNYGAWEVNATSIIHSATASISYLDIPNSVGPITYETFGEGVDGTFSLVSNAAYDGGQVNRTSYITLVEITS